MCLVKQIKDAGRSPCWLQGQARGRRDAQCQAHHPGARWLGIGHLIATEESEIDFEAEGLLVGVEGKARDARLQLLQTLADDGVSLDELRSAVEESRLALLPAERALTGKVKYSLDEIVELADVDLDFVRGQIQASGLPVPEPGEVAGTEEDLEMAKRGKQFRDAGLPEDGIREIARVIGMSMARIAEASQSLIGDAFLEPGDTEYDVAMRYAAGARAMTPMLGRTMEYLFARHLRETIRNAVMLDAELESGHLRGSTPITVAFADLVGFTSLGEQVEVGELGNVSGRLLELASSAAESPVRLVKMIGDAAMLVSREPEPLLEATLGLVEAVEEDEALPSLRAGVAQGEAIGRAGDWYGRPVNLASRITGFARAGSVVADGAVKDCFGEDDGPFTFSFAGKRRFKGIRGEIAVFRAKRVSNG
ncbi:MAG: adenylate cyclase [Solirubrobacterales bacterium]|nr:adenylate cyclase [Solirubrobacterales bacterium]